MADRAGITAILTIYRRPEYLAEQISALRAQSVAPAEIWLWINDHEANRGLDFGTAGADRVIRSNVNWKYAGRFAAALLARTPYVAMFDDDTIPGARWFENCLQTTRTRRGILGTAGVVFTRATYDCERRRFGWAQPLSTTVEVDFTGHAWFFERDWLKYFWMEPLASWDTAEDMHFSYAARKFGGVRTYCPPHPPGELARHGSIRPRELGVDGRSGGADDAEAFYAARARCFDIYRERGWPLRYRHAFWWFGLVDRSGAAARLHRWLLRFRRDTA